MVTSMQILTQLSRRREDILGEASGEAAVCLAPSPLVGKRQMPKLKIRAFCAFVVDFCPLDCIQ
jgi:hypothetical protein